MTDHNSYRYLIPLLILGFLTLELLAGPSIQPAFDQGNRLFEEGKYAEALKAYQQAESQGSHWNLFYNMGNCYYRMNRFVMAKIYYLRAHRLKPFHPAIRENIDIVNRQFKDKIAEEEPDFITRTAGKIESLIPLDAVSVVLVLAVLTLNGFIFLVIRRGKKKALIYGLSFTLVFCLLILSYHAFRTDRLNRRDLAVIVKDDAILRSGPGESNTVLFKVNPGLKVRIIETRREWLEVSASKQVAGWIKKSEVETI